MKEQQAKGQREKQGSGNLHKSNSRNNQVKGYTDKQGSGKSRKSNKLIQSISTGNVW